MTEPIDTCELRRIPGLFRRWELAQMLVPGEDYHLEDAGITADGSTLIAVYRSIRREADDAD